MRFCKDCHKRIVSTESNISNLQKICGCHVTRWTPSAVAGLKAVAPSVEPRNAKKHILHLLENKGAVVPVDSKQKGTGGS